MNKYNGLEILIKKHLNEFIKKNNLIKSIYDFEILEKNNIPSYFLRLTVNSEIFEETIPEKLKKNWNKFKEKEKNKHGGLYFYPQELSKYSSKFTIKQNTDISIFLQEIFEFVGFPLSDGNQGLITYFFSDEFSPSNIA